MARADSTIAVHVTGDTRDLTRELKKADKGVAGLGSSMKGLVGAAALTGLAVGVTEFAQSAIAEADRLGDASKRLELQLGESAQGLIDSADTFSELGQSAQDILELEAAFADVATALGIADPMIASFADDAAATAAAVSLLTGEDPSTVIANIGKAADGSERAMKALGINLTTAEIEARALKDTGKLTADTLTEGEIAAAGMALVLEELAPKIDAVTGANAGLEEKQKAVEAKFETLMGKIGAGLEGPLNDLLSWILSGVEGWEMFAGVLPEVEQNIKNLLGPIAAVAQALDDLIRTIGSIPGGIGDIARSAPSGGNRRPGTDRNGVTINVQPNAHDDTERAVVNALRDHNRRNGIL